MTRSNPTAPLIATALALLVSSAAQAQDDDDARRSARDFENEVVREVVRGFYMKADLGSTIYFNTHGVRVQGSPAPLLSGVMSLELGLGADFIDRERFSAAWEVQFGQGLFNGPRVDQLPATAPFVEGDIHTFSGTAAIELSAYASRRFGIGMRAGGGVMVIPLLMGEEAYRNQIVAGWGGAEATLHQGPLPMLIFGPTIEYYTKLSHFSVGIDADASYVIGFDLGLSPYGYLKYTF
ncbi:MAG: adventurous gliding motility protein CglE [Myxococcota bacterium]